MNHLLFFSGADCDHCEIMRRLISRMETEFGIIVDEREVWTNESNYRLMENYTRDTDCPGIPVFINTTTNVVLCGEVTYKQLVSWAQGANVVQ